MKNKSRQKMRKKIKKTKFTFCHLDTKVYTSFMK